MVHYTGAYLEDPKFFVKVNKSASNLRFPWQYNWSPLRIGSRTDPLLNLYTADVPQTQNIMTATFADTNL